MKRIYGIVIMLVAAMLALAIDLATKAWVVSNMQPGEIRPVLEGVVQLRYTQNSGAAFGMLQGWAGALSVAAIAIIVAIVLSASKVSGGKVGLMLGMGLVLGGAIGNLLDRLRLGYVTDFVEATVLRANINDTVYTFPVFNAADSAITVGVFLILAILLFGRQEPAPAIHDKQSASRPRIDYDNSAWLAASGNKRPQPITRDWRPPRQPTAAGWAGFFAVIAGFLIMALRSAARER